MPDAINHLSAFNRIAAALENLPEDDLSALITAINAIANKEIPVADMTGVVTAINNKTIPSTDLTGVVTAINNISISGGGGVNSGSLDCECLADVLAPLIEKIDQLVCVIVPIANSQHQIEKIVNYWMQDGPNMGIDAPPGTFIFPVPGDSAPSLPYTPNPNATPPTVDETGAWTSPPTINGIVFTQPPGGMQGTTDGAVYNEYKCNVSYMIMGTLYTDYDNMKYIASFGGVFSGLGVAAIYDALYYLAQISAGLKPATTLISGLLGSFKSTWLIETLGARSAAIVVSTITSQVALNAIAVIILDCFAAGFIMTTAFQQMINLLQAHKAELACALYKAKTIEEARTNFIEVVDKYGDTLLETLIGKYGNGQLQILQYLLTDALLANLFACPVDLDPADIAGLGAANGGCVDCILCGDTTEQLTVNKSSVATFDPLTPGNYEPYPLTVNIGTIHSDIICCVAEAAFANGSGRIDVIIGGVVVAVAGWGDTLEYGEVRIVPVAPATVFDGEVTLKMYHAGTLANGAFTLHSVGWRDVP